MIEGPAIFQFGSFRRMSCHRSMFEPGFETRPDASGNGERRVDAAAAVYPHALYLERPRLLCE
jgi:hypothetical protein